MCGCIQQACGRFINNNSVTKAASSSSKSPELLARYCDLLLKKRYQKCLTNDPVSKYTVRYLNAESPALYTGIECGRDSAERLVECEPDRYQKVVDPLARLPLQLSMEGPFTQSWRAKFKGVSCNSWQAESLIEGAIAAGQANMSWDLFLHMEEPSERPLTQSEY